MVTPIMKTSRASAGRDTDLGSARELAGGTRTASATSPERPQKPQGGWVIYARCSTDDQAKGTTIESQTTACEYWLKSLGHPIRAVITDPGYSGSTMDRPGMQRLRDMVIQGGVEGVVAVKLDRLSRKLKDMLAFYDLLQAHGTQLCCVRDQLDTTTPAGRVFFQLQSAFAEFEHGLISERQKASHAHHRAKGLYAGGVVAAGLMRTGTIGNYRLEVDPVWGPIIAKSWDLIVAGKSYRDVMDYLQIHQVPHRSKKPWSIQSVWSLFNRGWARGTLVSPEVYDHVRRILAKRWCPTRSKQGPRQDDEAPTPSGNSERVWRLQGVATCAHCGAAMTGTHGNGNGGKFFYLKCSARSRRGRGGCTAKNLPAETWELRVIRALRHAVENSEGLAKAYALVARERLERVAGVRARHETVSNELGKLHAALDKLIALATQESLVARALGPTIADHQRQIETLEMEQTSLRLTLDEAMACQRGIDEVIAYLRAGLDVIETAGPEEQKRLLRGVIARAKIGLNEQGPMPIHLTVKIPLGTQGGVKDSSNLGSPADPLKRVEPAASAAGSTGRLQWCAGGDSNPDESYLASTSSLWR